MKMDAHAQDILLMEMRSSSSKWEIACQEEILVHSNAWCYAQVMDSTALYQIVFDVHVYASFSELQPLASLLQTDRQTAPNSVFDQVHKFLGKCACLHLTLANTGISVFPR
jgi:hypothetical protein